MNTVTKDALKDALDRGKEVQWANEIGLRMWFRASMEDIESKFGQPAITWRIKE